MEDTETLARLIAKVPRIPPMTVRRLSTYYRILRGLESHGDTEPLSSERMSQLTGFTAAQVRRARFRERSPAAEGLWPLLQEARMQALSGTPPRDALQSAQGRAQALLDEAWPGSR